MFIDRANIFVRSGKGGAGCVSFRREKFVPKGGPDGGDGGDGGSVVFVATSSVQGLASLGRRRYWHADNGQPGGGVQRHGRSADDLVIPVPLGTLVYDWQTDQLIVDLDAEGKHFTVTRGGKGGFGNEHFKSATNQTPQKCTPGQPADPLAPPRGLALRMELKLIADVGLIGKPNAGKSTLLSRVSGARPKIADYPFTTLEPNLGIAELSSDRRLVIADVPGLIEGAATGHGLGIEFLRHIERTRVLVHLIEVDPVDGSDPVQNYHTICNELASYSPQLAVKPQLLALAKMDLMPTEERRAEAVKSIQKATGVRTLPVSSVCGIGLRALLESCWKRINH